MTVTTKTDSESKSPEHSCRRIPAKWFVSLDDRRIPVPERVVRNTVIRAQAGVPEDKVLVRDHNSAEDEVLDDNGHIDCAEGNVLYTMPRCDSPAPTRCTAPAKIAFSVDDRVEETLNHSQTGTTLLDLFGLERDRSLFRDYETPDDQAIKPEDHVNFVDGPVFYTRAHAPHAGLEIIVNHRTFTKADGVRPVMKAKEIAALVTTTPADFDTYAGKEAKGDPIPPEQDGIAVSHNHPSGCPQPSSADVSVTRALREATSAPASARSTRSGARDGGPPATRAGFTSSSRSP